MQRWPGSGLRKIIVCFIWCCIVAGTWSFTVPCFAGGTAENLVLVVNANSQSSKNIANHYITWRNVPPGNVIYLDDVPDKIAITVDQFRKKILEPIISEIQARKLSAQVDYIVYSSGFPTRITVGSDIKAGIDGKKPKANKVLRPNISINAATYFLQIVMAKQTGYLSLSANWYMRTKTNSVFDIVFLGDDKTKYDKARRLYSQKKFAEAKDVFQELAVQYPDNYIVLYQIARCYGQQGNAVEASLALHKAATAGWQFGKYTKEDPAFDKVKENAGFKNVVDSLADEEFRYLPTRGFRSRYAWQPNGIRATGKHTGRKYFLSTVLAVDHPRGTTDAQSLAYLRSAIDADGSQPKGTFYFTSTGDIRTKIRKGNYADTIEFLEKEGFKAQVVKTHLPNEKKNVLGVSMGKAGFNWLKTKSKIVPGAICENLTSHGGQLDTKKQTTFAEFLKHGAAGSSGTIVEPYAIQAKFPHPMIHLHYVRGCSLAEAFYQSVHGPFQLLIVGDALCRPFAVAPEFDVTGLKPMEVVKGIVNIEVKQKSDPNVDAGQVPISHYELFTDGLLRSNLPVGKKIRFDSSRLTDGYHELRIVAVADDPIETRGRVVLPFIVNNYGKKVELKTGVRKKRFDANFVFNLNATDAQQIVLYQNGRQIANFEGSRGQVRVACSTLGLGPSTLFAVAAEGEKKITSRPLKIEVIK